MFASWETIGLIFVLAVLCIGFIAKQAIKGATYKTLEQNDIDSRLKY